MEEPIREIEEEGPDIENCMGFEDFVWFLLSYNDRLNEQSLNYWFKVLDISGEGKIMLSELEKFYRVIHQKREILQLETFEFSSIYCLIKDMFNNDKHNFELIDLISYKEAGAIFTAIFTDHFKFSEFVDRKTFVLPKEIEYSNWVKFIEYEYIELTQGNENEEFEGGFDLHGIQ